MTGQITYGTLISGYLTQCRPGCMPLFLQLQQEKVFPTLPSLRGGYETYKGSPLGSGGGFALTFADYKSVSLDFM